jgi:hypothetical protein
MGCTAGAGVHKGNGGQALSEKHQRTPSKQSANLLNIEAK